MKYFSLERKHAETQRAADTGCFSKAFASARLIPVLAVLLILGGCSASSVLQNVGGLLTELGTPRTAITQISVIAKPDANGTSATALDVVFIYNDKVDALLPKNALDWFTQRDELRANLWKYIDVASVEIPPSYLLDTVPLPEKYSTAIKVVAYANYLNKKGRTPLDLTTFSHPLITLNPKTVLFVEQNK